jgi:NAD+ kinase
VRVSVAAARDGESRKVAERAVRTLRERGAAVTPPDGRADSPPDIVVAIGDGAWLMDILRSASPSTAVLCVGHGFFAEVAPDSLDSALRRVAAGEHAVEERMRLEVVAGSRRAHAINEAALTTSRGAGFLRYSLEIDGELVWRDAGDGVIISTPAGSTGYARSAGGPVVMENAEAMVVVPVCSSTGQRPLVLKRGATVQVAGVESRLGCIVILDGRERVRVREAGFEVRAAQEPLRFVRLGRARYLRVFGKLATRRAGPPLPAALPPSAKFVFHLLASQGPLTEKQIVSESGLAERTVRSGLSWLLRAKRVRRVTSLRDAREAIFALER